MGKAEKERLNRALTDHLNTIHETLQALDQAPPASSLEKVPWDDVIKMGEQISKHATTVGMLWTGEKQELKALEENMAAYFNLLQGFILLSHGSLIGAGATLSSCIHASVKQVVDCSFMLFKESVSSYESSSKARTLSIPQLVGTVWDACSALKKTPGSNVTAIGRAMTQVAVSIKDVLREMKELKPATSDSQDEASENGPEETASFRQENDLGDDLSPDEMKIAEFATVVVSETLQVVKELIRSVSGLAKRENPDQSGNVDSLERLLKLCQGIGIQMDELGACLYPPQEFASMKAASEKVSSIVNNIQAELGNLDCASETFVSAASGLERSLKELESSLGSFSDVDIASELERLVISGKERNGAVQNL